jgi:hypothetical protein
MNKIHKAIIALLLIISIAFTFIFLMFAEYRFIMLNIHPYLGENNTVYLEVFGQIDEYYVEDIE